VSDQRAPREIGPYPVVRKLGEGSFGEVFLGRQPSVGREVAIKRARIRNTDQDREAFLAMFLSETEVVGRLAHANIVSVIDAGQDADGAPYIVMEYVNPGRRAILGDVGKLLRKWQRLDPFDAAYITAGTAQALAHAHHEGVIHRDVKPSNILLSARGDIKLADFGIAKIQRAGQYAPTATEHFAGTPPYMAPELHDDSADAIKLDHRVDIWALGVVAWEAITGFRPFEDEALGPRPANMLAEQWLKMNARKGRRRSFHDVAPHAPQVLRELIEECLQPLEQRIATADELFVRLIDAGLGLPTHRTKFLRLFINDTMPAPDQMQDDTGEIDAAQVLVPSASTDRGIAPAAPEPPAPSSAPASVRAALGMLGPGDRFGQYDIVRKLGAGGMAIVYEATRTITLAGQQRVALKVIRPEHSANPEFLERFAVEAKIALGLNHQAIVRVLDAGEVDRTHFIAMDFIEGCDLDTVLHQYGRFPAAVVALIGYELATALRYAHARGIVHRDISPHNALITSEAAVLLADWGVAKPVSADGMVSRTGTAIGKPYYMPPEQLAGHPLDGRADLFAVGVTLFELLAGITPYAIRGTKNEHLHMLVKRVFENDRPSVREAVPDAPPVLVDVIEALLQPDASRRTLSAEELMQQLEPLVQLSARRHFAELVRHRDAAPEQRAHVLQTVGGASSTASALPRPAGTVELASVEPHVAQPSRSSASRPAIATPAASSRSWLLPILAIGSLVALALGAFLIAFIAWPGEESSTEREPAPEISANPDPVEAPRPSEPAASNVQEQPIEQQPARVEAPSVQEPAPIEPAAAEEEPAEPVVQNEARPRPARPRPQPIAPQPMSSDPVPRPRPQSGGNHSALGGIGL
jgi:serine/threonine protein kinase